MYPNSQRKWGQEAEGEVLAAAVWSYHVNGQLCPRDLSLRFLLNFSIDFSLELKFLCDESLFSLTSHCSILLPPY